MKDRFRTHLAWVWSRSQTEVWFLNNCTCSLKARRESFRQNLEDHLLWCRDVSLTHRGPSQGLPELWSLLHFRLDYRKLEHFHFWSIKVLLLILPWLAVANQTSRVSWAACTFRCQKQKSNSASLSSDSDVRWIHWNFADDSCFQVGWHSSFLLTGQVTADFLRKHLWLQSSFCCDKNQPDCLIVGLDSIFSNLNQSDVIQKMKRKEKQKI